MNIFRMDRKTKSVTYNIKNTGVGVCITLAISLKMMLLWLDTNMNFEIITVLINRPEFKMMAILCVHKPRRITYKL